MKTQLSVLPSVESFLNNSANPDDTLITAYCHDLSKTITNLAVLHIVVDDTRDEFEELLNSSISLCASLYKDLDDMRKEMVAYRKQQEQQAPKE